MPFTDYSKQLIPIEWLIEAYNTKKIKTLHSQPVAELFRHDYPLEQLCRLYPDETQAMRKAYDDNYSNIPLSPISSMDDYNRTMAWLDKCATFANEQMDSMFELMIRMVNEHYSAHDQFTFMMAIC